jgi:hypothetical protein
MNALNEKNCIEGKLFCNSDCADYSCFVALNKSSLLLKIENTKCTNITTIYHEYSNIKYLQKLLKILSWKAWEDRLSGLI